MNIEKWRKSEFDTNKFGVKRSDAMEEIAQVCETVAKHMREEVVSYSFRPSLATFVFCQERECPSTALLRYENVVEIDGKKFKIIIHPECAVTADKSSTVSTVK